VLRGVFSSKLEQIEIMNVVAFGGQTDILQSLIAYNADTEIKDLVRQHT
jgi:hypothetical protein